MTQSSSTLPKVDVRSVPRAAWVATVALIAAPSSRQFLTQSAAVSHVVSAIAAASLALLTLWLLGVVRAPRDAWRMRALRMVPPIALLVAFAGTLSLAAAVPAALWTGAYARHSGRRAGLIAAAFVALALGIVGAMALGTSALLPWLAASALSIAAAVAAPTIQVAPTVSREAALSTAGARRRRPSALTGDHAAVSRDRRASGTPREAAHALDADTRALEGFLEDARELLGADEVVLWRWSASAEEMRLIASAGRDRREQPRFPLKEAGDIVHRAAREGGVADNGVGHGAATMLAGCVDRGEQLYGAVSVYAPRGVSLDREGARVRVARLATQMGLLLELLESRHRAESEGARTRALLEAAEEFQRNLDQAALHRAICEWGKQVTGAVRATFVTWDADAETGEIASATDYERVRPGMVIARESVVSEACRMRQRTSVPNVPFPGRERIFAPQEGQIRIGSLAVVPLVHEHRTIGAIVVESAHRDALGGEEAGTLALLATVAVPSLEAARRLRTESERAFTDPLTGLANRRAFDERLSHVLNTSDRYGDPVSLILVDIDHFKRVNDGYGHDAGDEVLRSIGRAVGGSVRTIDMAARFGGEEIAILLPKTRLDGARELAERLRREIANRPVPVRNEELRITASFGVACYPESSRDQRALFTNADAALYEAKAAGRNQVKCARQHEASAAFTEMV